MSSKLSKRSDPHNYNTRKRNSLNIPLCRTVTAQTWLYAHSLGFQFCTKIVINLTFFFLSPSFLAFVNSLQNSPLGELIKFIVFYCIVWYNRNQVQTKLLCPLTQCHPQLSVCDDLYTKLRGLGDTQYPSYKLSWCIFLPFRNWNTNSDKSNMGYQDAPLSSVHWFTSCRYSSTAIQRDDW